MDFIKIEMSNLNFAEADKSRTLRKNGFLK